LKQASQPDTANTAGRDEHAEFAEFIAGPHLPMGSEVSCVFNDSGFCLLVHTVLWIGLTTVFVQQSINSTVFHCLLVAVEGVA
jgi:hypothetical protein